jgi:superfamily I DNA/RNA helicase
MPPKNSRGEKNASKLIQLLDYNKNVDLSVFPERQQLIAKNTISKLVGIIKNNGIDPNLNESELYDKIVELIKDYNIDTTLSTEKNISTTSYKEAIIKMAIELLKLSIPGNPQAGTLANYRDHDDTMWLTAINKNLNWPHYDVVLADEIQDFNECQILMLNNLSKAGARIMAVGDPNQAIYMFRGAKSQSFEKLSNMLGQTENGSVS